MKMENNVRFAGVNTDAKALEEQNEKLKKQEAEIKRIKSLSKEELELYLLQEEAIKQIKSK